MFNSKKAQIEKKNDLIKKAESILNQAEMEKRELTDDEAQELAEIRDDVRKIKEALDIADELDESRACGNDKPEESREQESRELMETRSFEAYIRNTVLETRTNNMTETDNGAVNICPILERSTKYNLKGDIVIPYYDESSTAITVGFAEEFTDLTSAVGEFTSIKLSDYLAGALVLVSRKLINNSQFDIVSFVIDKMAYAVARFIENVLLNGGNPDATTHVNQVKGIAGSVTQIIPAGSTSAITADKLIDLKDSVKDAFQNNAIWIMSSATRTELRKLTDDVGRFLLNDDLTSPFGTTLMGKPVYVSDNMPDIAENAFAIYYGDMASLATKFGEEMNIQVLREKYATMHATGIVGWVSFDAKIEQAQGISALKMAVS